MIWCADGVCRVKDAKGPNDISIGNTMDQKITTAFATFGPRVDQQIDDKIKSAFATFGPRVDDNIKSTFSTFGPRVDQQIDDKIKSSRTMSISGR
ncbi:hypothetical protein EB118_12535 [bacterium]|nr:hypothetical protein [bacterium]NDG30886.1 hypothetical protein [bacterium]